MESASFLALVKRSILVVLGIPVIMGVVAYFLVRKLPNTYTSQSQISTGTVDRSQQSVLTAFAAESQINQEFANMITVMQMKKVVDQVSYQLILHDLTSSETFHTPSKDFKNLNESARKHAIAVYTRLYQTHGALSLWDKDQDGLNRVLISMGYDDGAIVSALTVTRAENSDFISVKYESENSLQSAFVVNTLISEFISFYSNQNKGNQLKTVAFLDSAVIAKKQILDSANDRLQQYKIENHILNLQEQARSLYDQISDFETRKQDAEKQAEAYEMTNKNIDKQFDPKSREYMESALTKINGDIIELTNQRNAYTDAMIRNNFSTFYKAKSDSIQNLINEKSNESLDKSIYSPLAAKSALVNQKLQNQQTLDVARYSINSLTKEINRLKSKLDVLVPNEARIATLENNVEIAGKDYEEIQQKESQAALQVSVQSKLRQVDVAMPGTLIAAKKLLLVIDAVVVSEILILLVLFIMFYLDNALKDPKTLAYKTNLPVLGHLNVIDGATLDLKKLWDVENRSKMQQFKDLLRSIRFEIDQELNGAKVLAITSLEPGEGKTLLAISLAYSYSIINKKVLLIDGNLDNPSISEAVQPKVFVEEFFREDGISDASIGGMSVLGNHGTDVTLLEIENQDIISDKFAALKKKYDIIIIEVPSMDALNKAKEWMLFADKTIAVFEANQTLNEEKNSGVNYLKALGPKFAGWIFNKTNLKKA